MAEPQKIQSAARKVLILAYIAFGLVLCRLIIDCINYAQTGGLRSDEFLLSLAMCAIGLAVAFCGWYGARHGHSASLCWFSGCNLLNGCWNCGLLVVSILVCVGSFHWRRVAGMCQSGDCSQEQHEELLDACAKWDGMLTNTTERGWNNTRIHELLSEEHCLDTLHTFGSVVLVMFLVLSVLSCCHASLNCASGYYGLRLRRLVRGDARDDPSTSEVVESSEVVVTA